MSQDDQTVAVGKEFPQFTPQLSLKWALDPWQLAVVGGWSAFFVLLSYLPLQSADVWGHVNFGNWILAHQALPGADPFLPLAEGMRLVNSRWLGEVLLALIDRAAGPDGLVSLLAAVILITWLIVWRAVYLRTAQFWPSLLITGMAMVISWSRWSTLRLENLGMLCLAILCWILESDRDRETGVVRFSPKVWIGVPLTVALWANLDESFVWGLAVVWAHAAEALWRWFRGRTNSETAAAPARLGCWVWLAEFALLAAVLNPHGMDLVWHSVLAVRNANLQDVPEWQPLTFGAAGSYEFVGAWVLGIVALRRSRRPLAIADALLPALFSLGTLSSNRMIGWFAITWGIALARQISEVLETHWLRNADDCGANDQPAAARSWRGRSWRYNYVALLIVWCAFAASPASQQVLGGKSRTPEQICGQETPLLATAYLREHPPQTLIFNPQWWGDWIVRDGPSAIRVFVAGNIQQMPHRVWEDYLLISRGQAGWQNALGRYAVETVVIDHLRMPEFDKALRRDPGWRVVHEDPLAAIFERRAVPGSTKGNRSPPAVTTTTPDDCGQHPQN